MEIFLFWIVMALACGIAASVRGRSFFLSFLGGLALWPIVLVYQLAKPTASERKVGHALPGQAAGEPRPFQADGVIAGIPYRNAEGGAVIVLMAGGEVRFADYAAAARAMSVTAPARSP